LCSMLSHVAMMRAEDSPNGVAVVLVSKRGIDMSNVKEQAHKVEHAAATAPAPAPAGQSCALFDATRGGATMTVVERPNSVRLVMTASDPKQLKTLREQVRAYVSAQGAGGEKGTPSPTQPY